MTKAIATLLGAAAAGALVWTAAQLDQDATGGYWAAVGVLAGAGLVLAAVRLAGPRGSGRPAASLPTFLLAFVPVLVAAGWVLIAAQPDGNWFRDHVREWSGDIGLGSVVDDLATMWTVLALGLGLTLGLCVDRVARRPVEAAEPVAPARPVEDEVDRDHELVHSGVPE